MTYVILFEAEPDPARSEEYFELATPLMKEVVHQPGFIRIDRAKSVLNEGKVLSVSFWESEEAIQAWLEHPQHRKAQQAGRQGIFKSMKITRMKVISEREVPTGQAD